MGKGAAGKTQVTDYYMSMHYGISYSFDALLGIYVGEKPAWVGEQTTEGAIAINKPDLFGGNKKEGGLVGQFYYLPGGPTQILPDNLAQRLGLTGATAPGYRGIASGWFTGSGGSGGFLWTSNNPYLRDIAFKVRAEPVGLNPTYAMIGSTLTLEVNESSVTVNGVTASLPQGEARKVGTSTVTLYRKSTTVDGTEIIIDLSTDFISVGGVEVEDYDGSDITINGVDIHITGTYTLPIGGGTTRTVANFTANFTQRTDANPVHVIYESMRDTDWGMNGAPSSFDLPNWEAVAHTIYNERFGVSLNWLDQTTIEAFIGELIDHIQATVFVHPTTGLWTIRLIRGDYDIADLPVFDTDNCELTSFDRKAWAETINEIVVTWTNPENEGEQTITAQNDANITIQGAIVSDSRNYYAIRNADLATYVAYRDLRQVSTPLAVAQIKCDRGAAEMVPGDVFVLDYDEPGYEIEQLVMRVLKVDYGKAGSPSVTIDAVEDIFALEVSSYTTTGGTQWSDNAENPAPIDFAMVMTPPLYVLTEAVSIANLTPLDYPETMTMVLAAQDSKDTYSFDLLGTAGTASGGTNLVNFGNMTLAGHAATTASLAQQNNSTGVAFDYFCGRVAPAVDVFVLLGTTEANQEIALITGGSSGNWTLRRGALDTTPKSWSSNTPVWFFEADTNFIDETARSEGETVTYRILPRTSRGVLAETLASDTTATLTARPWLPLRPADVRVNGTRFGTVDIGSATSFTVTWANRNRLTQPTAVAGWTDGDMTPETGQTTTIHLLDASGVEFDAVDGLTGTTHDIDVATMLGGRDDIRVQVTAKRDGLESLQGHTIRVVTS